MLVLFRACERFITRLEDLWYAITCLILRALEGYIDILVQIVDIIVLAIVCKQQLFLYMLY